MLRKPRTRGPAYSGNVAQILVLYSSFDGQTERIASRIGAIFAGAGHGILLRPATAPDAGRALAACDAVVVGGAVRFGHFSKALESFVTLHAASLAARPNAFFCVCLSARKPGNGEALAACYVDEFAQRTGWAPSRSATFAGALPYRRYNLVLRWVMRLISAAAGGDTDTRRDYEYTDWQAVERFAKGFAWKLDVARVA